MIQNMYGWSGFYASLVASDTAAHLLLTWASAGLVVLLWALACRGGWQDIHEQAAGAHRPHCLLLVANQRPRLPTGSRAA